MTKENWKMRKKEEEYKPLWYFLVMIVFRNHVYLYTYVFFSWLGEKTLKENFEWRCFFIFVHLIAIWILEKNLNDVCMNNQWNEDF